MTERTINTKAKKYMELKEEIKSLEKELDKIKEEITKEMGRKTELDTNKYIIKTIVVNSTKFDTTNFKVKYPDLFDIYNIANPYKKFVVKEV